MTERFDAALGAVSSAAYVLVCAGLLLWMFPGARQAAARAWAHQLYAWQLGRRRVAPSSAWVALARDDLPAEPRP